MKSSWLLATVLWTSVGGAPASSFSAIIAARGHQSLAGTTGVASFKVERDAIRYEVRLASLRQVTDIVLMANAKPIRLYSADPTGHETVEATGILTATDLQGMSVADLQQAMDSGKTEVVVFTSRFPDGSITGKVKPEPEADRAVPTTPEPKVTATT